MNRQIVSRHGCGIPASGDCRGIESHPHRRPLRRRLRLLRLALLLFQPARVSLRRNTLRPAGAVGIGRITGLLEPIPMPPRHAAVFEPFGECEGGTKHDAPWCFVFLGAPHQYYVRGQRKDKIFRKYGLPTQ